MEHAHSKIKFKSLCSCSLCNSPAPTPPGGVKTTGIVSVVVRKPYEHQPSKIYNYDLFRASRATQFRDVEILLQVVDITLAQVLAAAKCTIDINSQILESQLEIKYTNKNRKSTLPSYIYYLL